MSAGNNVGNEGASYLNEALKENSTLTKLDLGSEMRQTNTRDKWLMIMWYLIYQKTASLTEPDYNLESSLDHLYEE